MKFAIPISCFETLLVVLIKSAENIGMTAEEAKELTDQYSKDLFAAFPQSRKIEGKFGNKEEIIVFSDEDLKPKENPFVVAERAKAAEADAVAAAEALEGMA